MADISATLTTLIENATNDLATLETLIQEVGSGTPVAEVGDQPTVDIGTQIWTFAQSVANAGSEFLGVYKLTQDAFCALLSDLDIIAFVAPQAPNVPARILLCGEDPLTGWTDLPALIDLEEQIANRFSIRSATPFEVKIQLSRTMELETLDGTLITPDGTGLYVVSMTGNEVGFQRRGGGCFYVTHWQWDDAHWVEYRTNCGGGGEVGSQGWVNHCVTQLRAVRGATFNTINIGIRISGSC